MWGSGVGGAGGPRQPSRPCPGPVDRNHPAASPTLGDPAKSPHGNAEQVQSANSRLAYLPGDFSHSRRGKRLWLWSSMPQPFPTCSQKLVGSQTVSSLPLSVIYLEVDQRLFLSGRMWGEQAGKWDIPRNHPHIPSSPRSRLTEAPCTPVSERADFPLVVPFPMQYTARARPELLKTGRQGTAGLE